jgi:superkiller protein 3
LALLYNVSGKYQQAEAVYGQLIAVDANDAEAHAGLGLAYLHDHKTVPAQAELSKAVTLNPRLGDAYGDLAAAASANKNYELALHALDARSQLLPENAGTVFLRATTLDNLRDYKRAAAGYRQFLQMVAQSGSHYPDQEWQATHRLIAIDPPK